ncbi:MAG: phosphatase PAP2 family protein [Acidimicrobiia bacterium]|nr:phosphatase PAP2 family protein [Acidimicrobiia bacterium]MDH3396228.1 phosphatase PAP2 family protein [Acidimicrobiia bacterium]
MDLERGISVEEVELGTRVVRELGLVGRRREFRVAGVRVAGRRRRPSGEKAPLPRELRTSGRIWLVAGLIMVAIWLSLFAVPATTNWWTRVDTDILRWFVDLRTSASTSIARAIHSLGSEWFVRSLRVGTLLALILVRRWRHVFAVLIAILIVATTVDGLQQAIGRIRPGVPIIGSWKGPSHPSAPIAALSVTLSVMAFTLVHEGKWRRVFWRLSAVALLLLGIARLYLGVDHPSDVLVSLIFAPAVAVVVFRLFAPESVFPVTWKPGATAHLDVTGARGEAIRKAAREQLGVEVIGIEPYGQEGSGGSTPMRLEVVGEGGEECCYLFAKLYSQTHLRSDRWYKLGRTILYGSLEDEVKFASVRRLVEYEDYIQRVMRDAGIPSAEPLGLVEITPEREFMMVSAFLDGSEELTKADIDERIIDDALSVIRLMWDAGLAHRDIKPANVMIREGRVVLIDVAFGTVRPTPWRQAVDLANMMVILALRTDTTMVYRRALRQFAPEDIAEAFAATHSITLPSQSRSSLALLKKERDIDVVKEFRELAPPAEPISIQRWSQRRVRLTIGAVLACLFLLVFIISQLTGGGFL